MIDKDAVSEVEYEGKGWNYQRLILSIKFFEGKQYLDVRKWMKRKSSPELEMMKTRKGLMLDIDDWKLVVPMINDMIASQKG